MKKTRIFTAILAMMFLLIVLVGRVTATESADNSGGDNKPATTIVLTIGSTVYTLNGAEHQSDAAPFIANGRTMVPLRLISEALGAEVGWDAATQTATITNSPTVVLTIGRPLPNDMGTPVIQGGRTFVPIRYVADTLGAGVDWNGATQSIAITGNSGNGNAATEGITSPPVEHVSAAPAPIDPATISRTSNVFRFYNDPERNLTLTADGMSIIVTGNVNTLWSHRGVRPSSGIWAMPNEPFLHLSIDIGGYITTNGISITPIYHPEWLEITEENLNLVFRFEDIPHGDYPFTLTARQESRNTITLQNNHIRVGSSGIEFLFGEEWPHHRARIDSYRPPVGNEFIRPQSDVVVAKANEITAGIIDPHRKAQAIFTWIGHHMTYDEDYTNSRALITAEDLIADGRGTCGDFTTLAIALSNAVGIPARGIVSGTIMNHAWPEIFVNGRWSAFDVQAAPRTPPDDNADTHPWVYLRHFDMSDENYYGHHIGTDAQIASWY